MPDEATPSAVTNFAEFEAAGGKLPAEPAKAAEPKEAAEPAETAAETAAETETAEEQPEAEKPAPKKKLSLAEETALKVKRLTDMRREERELQQRIAALKTQQPSEQASPASAPQPAAAAPRAERPDLGTWPGSFESWQAADTKWLRDEMQAQKAEWWKDLEQHNAEQQGKLEQQRIAQAYGEKLAVHVKEHPEYDEGLQRLGELPPHIARACLRTGPELTQALIDDPEATRRILALEPADQLVEIGKLAARVAGNGNGHAATTEATAETQQPVKVPARLNATGSSASVTAKPDHGAKSFAQWEEIERRLARRK